MEIAITFEQGAFAVRTDLGHFQGQFESFDAAAIYANGMQAGYNAAATKVGRAQGFRMGASAHKELVST